MDKLKVLYISHECGYIAGSTLSLENLLHSVRDFVDARIVVREEGVVSRYLQDAGFTVIVVPFKLAVFSGNLYKRASRFLRLQRDRSHFISTIRSALSGWSPDIIHSNSGVVDIGLYVSRALGVPHVWHLREYMGLDFDLHPFPSWHAWRKKIAHSNSVIAVSSGIYHYYNLDTHPGAIWINDAVRPSTCRQVVFPKDRYFVFCAGGFSAAKMPEVAVGAFRDSGVWLDGFRLRLVGNCPSQMRKDLISLAGNAASALDFMGLSADVREHMLHASGFLMTSKCEGLGRVTIEAMFYGCPVIARNTGGTLDVIKDGETGFLFDTQEQCSALIASLADNTPNDVIEKAADRAVELFSEERYGPQIMTVYNHLCTNLSE